MSFAIFIHHAPMPSTPENLREWRKQRRAELVERRSALPEETIAAYRVAMDALLRAQFPQLLAQGVVAFCWPFKNEYDSRFLLREMRERGAVTVLPVVLAPKTPLIFREWHPGVELAAGVYDIPYPVSSPQLEPDCVLLPMNGFDAGGYRLGYGGGFFDRTLAAAIKKPTVIGVTYEMARMDTIYPQPYDIPMDFVVTEKEVYERKADALRSRSESR
jgi:5-formyltetrahydrofolate cyclo-ligase